MKNAIPTDITVEYGDPTFNPQVRMPDGSYYFADGSTSEDPRDRAWNTTRLKAMLGTRKFNAWEKGETKFTVKLTRTLTLTKF